MPGTKAGGLKAAHKNRMLHGDDFYKRIGRLGGKKTGPKGFAIPTVCDCDIYPYEHRKSECAGAKGGRISRRGRGGEYKIKVTID